MNRLVFVDEDLLMIATNVRRNKIEGKSEHAEVASLTPSPRR